MSWNNYDENPFADNSHQKVLATQSAPLVTNVAPVEAPAWLVENTQQAQLGQIVSNVNNNQQNSTVATT